MDGNIIEKVCNNKDFYSDIEGCSPRWELFAIINMSKSNN